MAAEIKKQIQLEIAHVLFIDIVGYSKLLIDEQHALLETLNEIVRGTEQFRSAEAAGKLMKIPTGDGMALVFQDRLEAPAECALEISRALKKHPTLLLRMGVHSGPVSGVIDVSRQANVAGAGINIAQRVMDCGDAEHILLSKRVAEDLEQFARWKPLLHDLGECEVKHGVRVGVVNLYADEVGNPQLPKKFKGLEAHRVRVRWAKVAVGLVVLVTIVGCFVFLMRRPAGSLMISTLRSATANTRSSPALAGRFAGVWKGKMKIGTVDHDITLTVNSDATSLLQQSQEVGQPAQQHPHSTVINGQTLEWIGGDLSNVHWNLIPNADGQTAFAKTNMSGIENTAIFSRSGQASETERQLHLQ